MSLCLALLVSVLALGCASDGPPKSSVIHRVAAGENLYRIGLRYGVDPKRIAQANGIHDPRSLRLGQRLLIPGPGRGQGSIRATPGPSDVRPRAALHPPGPSFAWPLRGRLSSGFGMRRGRPHDGIDLAASHGAPIFAAEAGRVIHSGRMGGYGQVVIIKHAGSFRTVYAHASRLLVRKGEFVERGQPIAKVGSTGRSSGPHLHFEIRRQETPQNPLAFLR